MRINLRSWILLSVLVSSVSASIAAGLVLTGPPARARMKLYDEQRAKDLDQISRAINRYWRLNGTVPAVLKNIYDKRGYHVSSITDPRTKEHYQYRATGPKTYELCAVFDTDSEALEQHVYWSRLFSKHSAGQTCFSLEVETAR